MGLAEKQALAEFKSKYLTERLQDLEKAVGTKINVVLTEDTFTTIPGIQSFPDVFFRRITDGLKAIAKDQLGKDAIKESVKTIQVSYTADANQAKADLKDGILTVVGKWDGSAETDWLSASQYEKYLLSKL